MRVSLVGITFEIERYLPLWMGENLWVLVAKENLIWNMLASCILRCVYASTLVPFNFVLSTFMSFIFCAPRL
jgi:hypothetical protein